MQLNIIPIHNEHSAAVIDIILTIQQTEFNIPITIEHQPDLLDIDNFYYQNGGGFWGAEIDGQIVGTIALIRFNPDQGAIRKMFVKKEFRGKDLGIAGKLLGGLINASRDKGISDLYLGTVPILQAAIRFYEKNNFVQIKKEELPSDFPLMSLDTVFCHLSLK